MKANFVWKQEKFIQCENCGYERSYHLEADVRYTRFDWICPDCDQHWGGLMQPDGSIMIGQLKDREERHILVTIPQPWSPIGLKATRQETAKEAARHGGKPASVSDTFYLAPC